MTRRFLRILSALMLLVVGLATIADADAADCFRQMGIGYSAGYHAPAPFTYSPTTRKLCGWLHWKGSCCQVGGTPTGSGCCECGPAPCAPACAPSCDSCAPAGCGCGPFSAGRFPRPNPGVY